MHQFFSLFDPLLNAAIRGNTEDVAAYKQMELAKRNEFKPGAPFLVHYGLGSKLRDFVWVSTVPLVHDRVIQLLTLTNATGWGTYPVQLFDRNDREVQGYSGLSITGRCQSMFLDKAHSLVVYDEYPTGLYPSYKGLYPTLDSWDGSDLFTSADGRTGFTVVTAKVRDVLVNAGITNQLSSRSRM